MKISIFLILSLLFLHSCSKELTFEEKFEGKWSGVLTQKECCTFDHDVTIQMLVKGQNTASGTYSNGDYSICNNNLWDCEVIKNIPANCSFTWSFNLSNGSSVTFLETPLNLNVCAPGNVTLRLINDDMISVNWVDVNDSRNIASGKLTRK